MKSKIIKLLQCSILLSSLTVLSCNNVIKNVSKVDNDYLNSSENRTNKKYKIELNNRVYEFNDVHEIIADVLKENNIKPETWIGKKEYKNFYNELLINDEIQKFDSSRISDAFLNSFNHFSDSFEDSYNSYLPNILVRKKYIDFITNQKFDEKEDAIKSISNSLNKSFNKIFVEYKNNKYNIFSENDMNILKSKVMLDNNYSQDHVFEYKDNLIFIKEKELQKIYNAIYDLLSKYYNSSEENLFRIDFKVLTTDEKEKGVYYDSKTSHALFEKYGDWLKEKDWWIYKNVSKKWFDKYVKQLNHINGLYGNKDDNLEKCFDYNYDNFNNYWKARREYHEASINNNRDYLDFQKGQLSLKTQSSWFNWFTFGWYKSHNPTGFFNENEWFDIRFNFYFYIEFLFDEFKNMLLNKIKTEDFDSLDYDNPIIKEFILFKTKQMIQSDIHNLIGFNKIKINNKGKSFDVYMNGVKNNDYIDNIGNLVIRRNKIIFSNDFKAYSFNNKPFFYIDNQNQTNLTNMKIDYQDSWDEIFLLNKNKYRFDEYIKDTPLLNFYESSEQISNNYLTKYFSFLNDDITTFKKLKNKKHELWYLDGIKTSLSFGNLKDSYEMDFNKELDYDNLKNFNIRKNELKEMINPYYQFEAETANSIMNDDQKLLIKKYYNFANKEVLKSNYCIIRPEFKLPSNKKVYYKLDNGSKILLDLNAFNTFSIKLDKKYMFDKYSSLREFLLSYIENKKVKAN
ncbi:hypothetical protein [Mycoplasmopsis fermentans]|uniref:hypothetical protein n=1 Tax=Mycoplasmopsis fermentans TaxID=2115 RepID=UPI000F024C5D|nr:hypothetical protein [Mycoplasmopsis fermentans]RMX35595.1 putative lipoprotein [Mycoplasmopsis fermentans MF-I1]RMX35636.1 putative lipoprotein [Mycoplasmopsis fermentans MF-I2]